MQSTKSTWTIGKTLIAAFLAVAAIVLILGIVGYYGTESTKAICLSPSVTISNGFSVLFEVRHDWSNRSILAPLIVYPR